MRAVDAPPFPAASGEEQPLPAVQCPWGGRASSEAHGSLPIGHAGRSCRVAIAIAIARPATIGLAAGASTDGSPTVRIGQFVGWDRHDQRSPRTTWLAVGIPLFPPAAAASMLCAGTSARLIPLQIPVRPLAGLREDHERRGFRRLPVASEDKAQRSATGRPRRAGPAGSDPNLVRLDLPAGPLLGHHAVMGRSLTAACRRSRSRGPVASHDHARRVVLNASPLFTDSILDLSARTRATNRTGREGTSNSAPLNRFRSSVGRVWHLRSAPKRFSFDNLSSDAIACLPTFIQA